MAAFAVSSTQECKTCLFIRAAVTRNPWPENFWSRLEVMRLDWRKSGSLCCPWIAYAFPEVLIKKMEETGISTLGKEQAGAIITIYSDFYTFSPGRGANLLTTTTPLIRHLALRDIPQTLLLADSTSEERRKAMVFYHNLSASEEKGKDLVWTAMLSNPTLFMGLRFLGQEVDDAEVPNQVSFSPATANGMQGSPDDNPELVLEAWEEVMVAVVFQCLNVPPHPQAIGSDLATTGPTDGQKRWQQLLQTQLKGIWLAFFDALAGLALYNLEDKRTDKQSLGRGVEYAVWILDCGLSEGMLEHMSMNSCISLPNILRYTRTFAKAANGVVVVDRSAEQYPRGDLQEWYDGKKCILTRGAVQHVGKMVSWLGEKVTSHVQVQADVATERIADFWKITLDIIASIALHSGSDNADLRAELVETGVMQGLLILLDHLDMLFAPIRKPGEVATHPCDGLKTAVMRALANLVYNSPYAQEVMRESGALRAALNHCVHDERNPYLREWSIFAIRNAIVHNNENQEIIRQMERNQEVPMEVLDGAGFEVDILDDGGLKLRRKDGSEGS
eukprot:Clim_evm118s109 gene=Clim_evmTU118s109